MQQPDLLINRCSVKQRFEKEKKLTQGKPKKEQTEQTKRQREM